MMWAAPQPAACFITADTIKVPGGGTKVDGGKPLVLVAHSSITVEGVLDVASHRGDTSTLPSECKSFSQTPSGPDSNSGGGGGAGGSFMTRAGSGGNGDMGAQIGQASEADTGAADHLRGGCPGQDGGGADTGTLGAGGGSVYLVSGDMIDLKSTINASGAGGAGSKNRAGGSGGGSGGMIVLYSATLTTSLTPVLIANGGGGSGGSPVMNTKGSDGSDPSVTLPLMPANGGGNGGNGYSTPVNALDGAAGASGGGGGGGGGGAAGYIRSNKPLTSVTVSPMADIVP